MLNRILFFEIIFGKLILVIFSSQNEKKNKNSGKKFAKFNDYLLKYLLSEYFRGNVAVVLSRQNESDMIYSI